MRVSCIFVSVAVMLAQQTSAAPAGLPVLGPMIDKLPGVSQVESMLPIDSFSKFNEAIESFPGVSSIEAFEEAIPLPNFSKRDAGVQAIVDTILDNVSGGKQIEAMIPFDAIPSRATIESLPGMSQIKALIPQAEAMIPQVQAMIPKALGMVPQVKAFAKSITIPNLSKRDGEIQALVSGILDQVPGGKQIESMIPFDAIPKSLPSQVTAVIPQVEAMIPQVKAMVPQVEAMIPKVLAMVPQVEAIVKTIAAPQ